MTGNVIECRLFLGIPPSGNATTARSLSVDSRPDLRGGDIKSRALRHRKLQIPNISVRFHAVGRHNVNSTGNSRNSHRTKTLI
jgi:hypothetical protein